MITTSWKLTVALMCCSTLSAPATSKILQFEVFSYIMEASDMIYHNTVYNSSMHAWMSNYLVVARFNIDN